MRCIRWSGGLMRWWRFLWDVFCRTWRSSPWFLFALQTKWGLELLPISFRQVLYLAIQLGYPFEILHWTVFAFFLIRRNRAGTTEERKG